MWHRLMPARADGGLPVPSSLPRSPRSHQGLPVANGAPSRIRSAPKCPSLPPSMDQAEADVLAQPHRAVSERIGGVSAFSVLPHSLLIIIRAPGDLELYF